MLSKDEAHSTACNDWGSYPCLVILRGFCPMMSIPLLTGNRTTVFWGENLQFQNLNYLTNLDPGYFQFVADICADQLDDPAKLDKPSRQRAAMMLRIVHGQGVESLMALFGALAQSPRFPVGWMLRYSLQDLEEVVGAISDENQFPSLLRVKPVTWTSISTLVHNELPDEDQKSSMTEKFAAFWNGLAREFLSEAFRDEYNSIKHGFRVMPGGFSASIGPPKPAGAPPSPPEEMTSLAKSEFGSFFLKAVAIDGVGKHHRGVSTRLRNWDPEALMADLHLIACSLTNVISCLRILSGFKPQELKFSFPDSDAAFVVRRRMLNEVETLGMGPGVLASDVKPVSQADIHRGYETAT
jgi:hypothetical protein